ncbi:MAG TPA: glycosyltransferase 87 family protein [Candidatus Dormibacteraeota bacterium]|nr:glycosyltransferase 87 family protein [Candidatus Dormibacteraeota bacterium]
MTSTQPGPAEGATVFGWVPRLGTAACLCIALVFSIYLFTPVWWPEIGTDAKDLYAAGVLSASGGNPYQIAQQAAEEDRLYNPPGVTHRYNQSAYGYPPVVTAALRLGARVSEPAYYLISLLFLLGVGLAGFEASLALLHWRSRWLARVFFLASAPMALDLFVGNPSALLLLFCGAGAWLVTRGRPLLGGLLLSGMALKPQIGLPVAVAVIATAPLATAAPAEMRLRMGMIAAAGLGAGTAALALLGELLLGPGSLASWFMAARDFGKALGPGASASPFTQVGLAGLPALLMNRFSAPVAAILTAVVVVPAVAIVIWRHREALARPSLGPMAVGIALVLALSPYLHLNDLVLAAVPLLFVAELPLDATRRITLVTWAVGPYLALVVLTIVTPLLGISGLQQVGFGVVLTSLLLVSAVAGLQPTSGRPPL